MPATSIAAREPPVHAMNETCDTIGVFRRELRDTRMLAVNIDHRLRTLTEPSRGMRRPAGIIARLATVHLMSRAARTRSTASCKRHFADDRVSLHCSPSKQRRGPATTTQAGWAAELVLDSVQDAATNLLPDRCSGARATPWDIQTRCWHNGRMIGAGAIVLAQRK